MTKKPAEKPLEEKTHAELRQDALKIEGRDLGSILNFLRWVLAYLFNTETFTNLLAAGIVTVVVYKELNGMPSENEFWLLVGTVLGYYFKRSVDNRT